MPKPRSSSESKSDQSESSKMCLSTLMLSNGRSFLVLHYYIIYYSTVPFGPWLKKLKPCCLSLPPMRVKIYFISLSAEMDVCPMQYASGYLELFSSYFRIENNSISWSICLRTEEGPDTCYSREGRWWTDIGRRRENPSWWVGENCVNWMLIIIFWRTQTPIEGKSSKKSHSSLASFSHARKQ